MWAKSEPVVEKKFPPRGQSRSSLKAATPVLWNQSFLPVVDLAMRRARGLTDFETEQGARVAA